MQAKVSAPPNTVRVLRSVQILFLLALLTACGAGPSQDPVSFGPSLPPKTIVACIDNTNSVTGSAPQMYADGMNLVARSILPAVQYGQQEMHIQVRMITHETDGLGAVIITDTIPAVSPLPNEPTLNPLLDPSVKQRIASEYNSKKANASDELATAQAKAKEISGRITQHATQGDPPDLIGTDLRGCLVAATNVFGSYNASHRYLLMVSDFQPDGDQSNGTVDLKGVDATMVQYCDGNPDSPCDQLKAAWDHTLKAAGAQSITWKDSSTISDISQIFN